MRMDMKSFLSLATIGLLFPQLLSAATQGIVEKEVSKGKEEVRKGFEYAEERGAKNPPGFFISGDFLYWQAQEDGLEYAVDGISRAANLDTTKGKTREPNFEWEPGFRVGAGFTLSDTLWDIGAFWTRLNYTATDSVTASSRPSTPLLPILDNTGILSVSLVDLNSASAKWELHYNVLDFLMAREIKINKFLYLRPSGGLRFAWVNQNYNVSYDYAITPDSRTSIEHKNDFWGVGIRGGLDLYWQLYRKLSFFAKTGFTLFHGKFDVQQKNRLTLPPSTGHTTYINVSDAFTRITPEVDAALGLRVEVDFHMKEKSKHKEGKHCRFEFLAGWEYVLYPNQNQVFLFTDPIIAGQGLRERGDLSFQGFTLGALLHF